MSTSAGTIKTMEDLGACYSVNEDGYQAKVEGLCRKDAIHVM